MPHIQDLFQPRKQTIYSRTDLADLLVRAKRNYEIPKSTTLYDFIDLLLETNELKATKLRSREYGDVTRYFPGNVTVYQLALSLKNNSYLSHATALIIHKLTRQGATTIYVNKEQSPKPTPPGVLTQESIDKAFANQQRESRYIFSYRKYRCIVLNGKNTGRRGVGSIKGPSGEALEVTGLERTLIDIAVRPSYAGGCDRVRAAYKKARGIVSIRKLVGLLQELDYKYPYHQAIGFYMKKAGYNDKETNSLRKLGLHLDFYLAYGMSKMAYDEDWKVYYPVNAS